MKSLNPFKFGKEVSGSSFYDRKEAAALLRQKMIDGSFNVVLFAPRRYGKTSLVQKVLRELADEDGIRGLCFDLTKTPTAAPRRPIRSSIRSSRVIFFGLRRSCSRGRRLREICILAFAGKDEAYHCRLEDQRTD